MAAAIDARETRKRYGGKARADGTAGGGWPAWLAVLIWWKKWSHRW